MLYGNYESIGNTNLSLNKSIVIHGDPDATFSCDGLGVFSMTSNISLTLNSINFFNCGFVVKSEQNIQNFNLQVIGVHTKDCVEVISFVGSELSVNVEKSKFENIGKSTIAVKSTSSQNPVTIHSSNFENCAKTAG